MILNYFGMDQFLLEIQISKITNLVQFVQIIENDEDQLEKVEISHQSQFVIIDREMVDQLKTTDCIGRHKIPISINLFMDGDSHKQIFYGDQQINQIYRNIEQKYNQEVILKYENQILERNDMRIQDIIYENDGCIQIIFTTQYEESRLNQTESVQKQKDNDEMEV